MIWETLFIEKLWNVGNPYIFPFHQEFTRLPAPIHNIESPPYCIIIDKENLEHDSLEHLQHLTFNEYEGS